MKTRHLLDAMAIATAVGLAALAPLPAVEIVQGVEYRGETVLEAPEYGASLTLPADWVAAWPADSDFLVMRSTRYGGYVFAAIEEMTVEEARQQMQAAIDVGDGVALSPRGPVAVDGRVLRGEYAVSGTREPLVGYVVTRVADHGLGVVLIAASSPDDASKVRETVDAIDASVVLAAPEARAAPDASVAGTWSAELAGRKLTHFFTRTGYTEEDYIWLCADGLFVRSFDSGGFGGGASGAFASDNAGRWRASGARDAGTLELTYNDGSVARYALTLEGTKLMLDGKRYFREATDCR